MGFKEFFTTKVLQTFFIVTTCVCGVMAVVGLQFDAGARFGYEQFFTPILFGVLSTIPMLAMYSKKELTVRQAIVRKAVQLVLVEGLILSFLHVNGSIPGAAAGWALALSVLVVYGTVEAVQYVTDNATAKSFNQALKALQENATKAE